MIRLGRISEVLRNGVLMDVSNQDRMDYFLGGSLPPQVFTYPCYHYDYYVVMLSLFKASLS